MKTSTTLALGAILSFVTAQPMMEKRDENAVSVTDVVVVTVDVYTTVAGNPPTGSPAANTKHANHIAYHAQNKAEVQAQPTPPSSSPPAQPPIPQNSPPPVQQKEAAPPASSSSAPSSAAPAAGSSPEEIQAAEDAEQEAVNQQQTNTNNAQKQADFAHQDQMISQQNGGQAPTSQPPAQQAPASSAPTAAAPSSAPPPSSGGGGGGGSCGSVGGSCSGDVTIYNDQGAGACGWTNDTNSEDFFALAAPMFGTYTNDAPGPHKNAFCGRMASIQVNGKSYTGMLTDRCGGCVDQSIDLSQHLFSQLYPNEPPGNGRYHNVPWEFTTGPIYSQG